MIFGQQLLAALLFVPYSEIDGFQAFRVRTSYRCPTHIRSKKGEKT